MSEKLNRNSNAAGCGQRGNAYLELLLVFPLLCLLAFGGLEYSRALNQLQVAVSLSREIANVAYRECMADGVQARLSANAAHFDQNICLAGARDHLVNKQHIASALPALEFSVAVYTFDPASGAFSEDGKVLHGTSCVGHRPECATKYNAARFRDHPELREALTQYGTLVVAEVFVPYRSIVSGTTPLFNFAPRVIYGTTIL